MRTGGEEEIGKIEETKEVKLTSFAHGLTSKATIKRLPGSGAVACCNVVINVIGSAGSHRISRNPKGGFANSGVWGGLCPRSCLEECQTPWVVCLCRPGCMAALRIFPGRRVRGC